MKNSEKMLVDVYFLMDSTGSMYNAIQGVKNEITDAVNDFCNCNPDVNLAYGVGWYKDTTDNPAFNFIQTITPDIHTTITNLNNIKVSGGADRDEGQVVALSLINHKTAGWRPGALRLLAWYGDEGGHATRVWDGNTYNKETAIDNLLEGNVIPIALSVGNNRLNNGEQAVEITGATSGRYKNDVKFDQLCITLFQEISERLDLKVPSLDTNPIG